MDSWWCLPWNSRKDRMSNTQTADLNSKPGEFLLRTLFAEFALLAEKKIDVVLSSEPLEKPLSKSLQRGEDPVFDQLLTAFGSVAEHCLPSLLRTLFAWYDRQVNAASNIVEQKSVKSNDSQSKATAKSSNLSDAAEKGEELYLLEKRVLAVEFVECLFLIEVLKQLPLHPGHEDLINHIENLAFKHFKFREGAQNNPNIQNINIIADLYAEVIGVLVQSRFQSVRKRFTAELKELRSKEPSPVTTHGIISLLLGMKFFRIKMVPIEEFEASFQFMHECATYFLEVKDKDIKHALAGLFVEILVPVAATVKHEVNVPCLKNFVELLYPPTLDLCTKKKHQLALFPLVTCLLCVSQKSFFLQNWHCFLAMCLSHLKNKDPKMSRVALESLYRLLWVYMIRIKCESNTATQSRLHSIVSSLFPKGSKAVVPRDTPLNIFVKIIQFIAQERLDFAMKEIVYDLLSVGRPVKIILTPERMSIGLRAFLVVADSLQQKEGEPPMPRTVGVLPSGNTVRVKKTYLNKMLTEDMARSIGVNYYYPFVRKALNDMLRALDVQFGRPLMMTTVQNINKEPDDMITGERKPKIDLFRTCIAAIPRLIPDEMSRQDLLDLLSRLTVHMDEEMRALSFQSLQNIINDFPDWRDDVIECFMNFMLQEINDTFPQLLDNALRMLLQFITNWKVAINQNTNSEKPKEINHQPSSKIEHTVSVFYRIEALALVMLCNCRQPARRLAAHILKETTLLLKYILNGEDIEMPVLYVIDKACPSVIESCLNYLPTNDKTTLIAMSFNVDLQWLADRSGSAWVRTTNESDANSKSSSQELNMTELKMNVWSACFVGFMAEVAKYCPSATFHAWSLVCQRLNTLYGHLYPTPTNDNRASVLLRSTTSTIKRTPNENGLYLDLWRNYVMFACCIAPSFSNGQRLPPYDLSSSPDSIASERSSENKSPINRGISVASFLKQIVPLIRNDQIELRNAAVLGLSQINKFAVKDLLEELMQYIREAIDRKQENMRRRKRRELLRVQLGRLLELIAEKGTFGLSSAALDRDAGSLSNTFIEYIDGIRLYLETENDKDSPTVFDIKVHFCGFVSKLLKHFPVESRNNLLSRDLRRSLFYLFASWSGKYGSTLAVEKHHLSDEELSNIEFIALQSMSSVLCCGPVFDPNCLSEDSNIYDWLLNLLESKEEKIRSLGHETIVLLLEYNPEIGSLLDWLVDCCFTKNTQVADLCFTALATIFSLREYPCDHYIAIINVTLMNIGCPRGEIRQIALQLLQILDYRFFDSNSSSVLQIRLEDSDESAVAINDDQNLQGKNSVNVVQLRKKHNQRPPFRMFEPLLSATFPCAQLQISKRMSKLHPQLTMAIFSEITYRFQTARPSICQNLLDYLIPWLSNMELVDPHIPSQNNQMPPFSPGTTNEDTIGEEGWGSAEATEMILNNLFYITVKFGDDYPKEIENVWASLCSSWPNNLRVVIRYLFIVTGLAPNELLPYSKRVVLFMAREKPERLIDEMMIELQTVESLNCVVERTETPPFFRITNIRKGSGHSEEEATNTYQSGGTQQTASLEQGTLHTKRHSTESGTECRLIDAALQNGPNAGSSIMSDAGKNERIVSMSEEPRVVSFSSANEESIMLMNRLTENESSVKPVTPQPRPLPMPEFGGYYAPLTEFLPDASQPIVVFHRCNLSLMLLCDVVVDGIPIDWTPHIPLMLHIIILGLDHPKSLVHEHCKQLLLNLLLVLVDCSDYLSVSKILLNNNTEQLNYGLTIYHVMPRPVHNFTEPPTKNVSISNTSSRRSSIEKNRNLLHPSVSSNSSKESSVFNVTDLFQYNSENPECDRVISEESCSMNLTTLIKSLIDFITLKKGCPLWNYEDITAKVWFIRSAEQLAYFLDHVIRVFKECFPRGHIEERWAEVAIQLALSCSSRHYAGRSLQVFRAIKMPINSRMLSDIVSRLVETVAEQGEDMQGYVTELMLTLEAAIESLDSEQRVICEFVREIFKSAPNLHDQESGNRRNTTVNSGMSSSHSTVCSISLPATSSTITPHSSNHVRSTSYSGKKGHYESPSNDSQSGRNRSNTDSDMRQTNRTFNVGNLERSKSAQSIKTLEEQYMTPDDKTSLLAQFFWIAIAMLETDYEHEFLLALGLLDKILNKFSLEKNECREKVDKIMMQLKWPHFPGLHALLLKGCTSNATFEPTMRLLHRLTPYLEFPVVDPSESVNSFPFNVMALLPYMLANYDNPNSLCINAAENIARWCSEKSKKLDNLATVMTLYSRRAFSKESFQWTKCVVKYLYDAYSHAFLNIVTFLVEVMDKGPFSVTPNVMSILHCIFHYMDITCAPASINADLNEVILKYIEGPQWKDALKIIKLIVTRSSTLAAAPSAPAYNSFNNSLSYSSSVSADCISIASGTSFADSEFSSKRELPGRTIEFTFDLTQTPIVGRKYLVKDLEENEIEKEQSSNDEPSTDKSDEKEKDAPTSPRRSLSYTHSFSDSGSNWRRPWLSQARTRERLIGLLTTFGQKVGLPKSPSVIFSQSSDIIDRQSSMASSIEEVSTGINEPSTESKLDDNGHSEQFKIFKDFDFLEYELESQEAENMDNFNWGVRRRSLSNLADTPDKELQVGSPSHSNISVSSQPKDDVSSDEEGGSDSPLFDGANEAALSDWVKLISSTSSQ
ncbi:protein furry-like protein [Dinothrombium tinctorium]|uniref:Protein furry-like protein n=1 Tax=Dinothrombium tinctorium TaxID=1965070 RepID=A0A443RMM6_9ACAR|nr:protein furry-like protein [Dinothrombium tinctorium]